MTATHKTTIIFTLTVILLSGFLSCGPSNFQSPRYIAVSASATVKVKPDMVIFKLHISTIHKELPKSKEMYNHLSRKLIALASQFKIAENDIRTDFIQISKEYENNNKSKKITFKGFRIRKKFTIILRDFSKYEPFYSQLIESDVTSHCEVTFTSSNYVKLLKESQRAALKSARKKAKYMARSLKQSIGDPILIEENPDISGNITPGLNELTVKNAGKIFPKGMLKITTRVRVRFELD